MRDLSFYDALRFMFSGVIAYFYLYICDATVAKNVLVPLGVIGIPIALFVIGTLIYLLYRPFIYDRFIIWLQDVFRGKRGNYRTYLKNRYRAHGIGSRQAQLIWVQVRDKYFKDRYSPEMKTTASGIHLIYLTGILAIPFAIWRFVVSDCTPGWIFIGIFLICFPAAFLRDRYHEGIELGFLRSLNNNLLDSSVSEMFPNISSTSDKKVPTSE